MPQCNYVIDVNVHIPWGPDVEVRQPLLIRAADNEAVRLFIVTSHGDQPLCNYDIIA